MTAAEVGDAADRVHRQLRPTPTLALEGPGGAPLVAKLEVLQPTGSFKVRGAVSLLTDGPLPPGGVVAASGGNFGLAVAWAARRLGATATVFVPDSSPRAKLARLRDHGAEVHTVAGYYADALAAAEAHQREAGARWAHAYDQRAVVAGQGTCAHELVAQHPDLDTILVACGGGGLLAGTAGRVTDTVRVVAVETHGTSTLHAALEAGRPVDVEVSGVAASALGARRLGAHAWAARAWVDETRLVGDDDVRAAQRWLWDAARVVAEPGGATALAALTSGAYAPAPGERVAVLVCGANTDPGEVVAAA